ncbi:MAG TPA: hypothetical protein VFX85_12900 [Solirubrobacterales bacterium]|nr:hypothetical protein [Solirubrobacterales bacterium]
MRRGLSLLLFLLLAGSATAAVLSRGGEAGAEAAVVSAAGDFALSNSREGMPIFTAGGIGPGDSARGTVEIADTGSETAALTLAQHDLADTPGTGGGVLSAQLTLRVTDVTDPGAPVTVYSGPLASMPPQDAGVVAAGGSRSFEFVATLPDAGPAGDQNALQGASTSVGYSWTASEAPASTEPPGAPPPLPPGAAPPAPTSPGSGPSQPPTGGDAALPPLRLAITRVRRALRHGRLLVWAGCNSNCRIVARGRLRLRGPHTGRPARLRLARQPHFAAGTQRLAIRVPRTLRRQLQANPRLHLVARIALRARNDAGETATARRTLRLRGFPSRG